MMRSGRIVGWLIAVGAVVGMVLLATAVVHRYHALQSNATLAFERPRNIAATEPAAPVRPATRPATTLPANTTCVTAKCHAALANAPHVHGPVSTGNCFACHGPDTGKHNYPIKSAGSATCTYCHAVTGTMKFAHKGLEKGCTTCHQPHTSQVKFLLKFDSEPKLCASCHTVTAKAFQHEPFGRGECSTCHAPHEADNARLLKVADGVQQCARCHEAVVRNAAAAPVRHTPATKDCTICHSPHSSDFKHELKASVGQLCSSCHPQVMEKAQKAAFVHAPVTSDAQCAACHRPHGGQTKDLLPDRQDRLCLSCHAKPLLTADGRVIPDMKPEFKESKYLHGPIRAGECSPCHESHAADEKNLLKAPFPTGFYTPFELGKYDLCFRCHEKALVLDERTTHLTGFRDGDLNLHYLHVNRDEKGRSCRSCHALHGSNAPNHIAQKVRFDGSDWTLDMNFTANIDGGSCQPGCHAKRDYKRSNPVGRPIKPADDAPNLDNSASTSDSTTQPTTEPTGGPS